MAPDYVPGLKPSKEILLFKAKHRPIVVIIGSTASGNIKLQSELTVDPGDADDVSKQQVIQIPDLPNSYACRSWERLKQKPDFRRYERTMRMVIEKVAQAIELLPELRRLVLDFLLLSRIRNSYVDFFEWLLLTPAAVLRIPQSAAKATQYQAHIRDQAKDCLGAILVYDRTKRKSFVEVTKIAEEKWIEYDTERKKWVKRDQPDGFPLCRPLCVVGLDSAKEPKLHAFKTYRYKTHFPVSTREGKKLADELEVEYFECCLWPRRGVTPIMNFIVGTYHNEFRTRKRRMANSE